MYTGWLVWALQTPERLPGSFRGPKAGLWIPKNSDRKALNSFLRDGILCIFDQPYWLLRKYRSRIPWLNYISKFRHSHKTAIPCKTPNKPGPPSQRWPIGIEQWVLVSSISTNILNQVTFRNIGNSKGASNQSILICRDWGLMSWDGNAAWVIARVQPHAIKPMVKHKYLFVTDMEVILLANSALPST